MDVEHLDVVLSAKLAPLEAGLAQADARLAVTEAQMRKLGAASAAAGEQTAAGFARVSASLAKVEPMMRTVGSTITRYVTVPTVAVGAAAVKMGMDFEKNMALLVSSAGAPQAEIGRLRDQVLDLARATQYGPNQLAEALYHIESLGYRGSQAMSILKVATIGATAGQADLEDVTNALGGAVRTNIKGATDYGQAMGTLNAITGAGNMRMDDLTAALGTGVLPAAKAAGLSLTDVGAALATMTDENMGSQRAATRLRMAFSLLAAASGPARKALAEIGLTTEDLGFAMQQPNGLSAAITLLKSHLEQLGGGNVISHLSDELKQGQISMQQFQAEAAKTAQFQVLSRAFGGGRSAAAVMLLVNNLDVLNRKYGQIETTASDLNQRALAQQQTELYKLRQAWSSVQVDMVKAGDALAPSVVAIADGVGKIADAFEALPGPVRHGLGGIAVELAVAGPVMVAVAALIKATGTVAKTFGMVGPAAEKAAVQAVAAEAQTAAAVAKANVALDAQLTLFEELPAAAAAGAGEAGIAGAMATGEASIVSASGKLAGLRTGLRGLAGKAFTATLVLQLVDRLLPNAPKGNLPGQPGLLSHIPVLGKVAGYGAYVGDEFGNLLGLPLPGVPGKGVAGVQNPLAPSISAALTAGAAGGRNAAAGKQKLLALAKAALGTPYLWGGSGPGGFDCSGLVQWAFANGLNVSLPRTTYGQAKVGTQIQPGQAGVGSLVFTEYGEGGNPGPGHVGMVVGMRNGQPVIEAAPHTGATVRTYQGYQAFTGGQRFTIRDVLGNAPPVFRVGPAGGSAGGSAGGGSSYSLQTLYALAQATPGTSDDLAVLEKMEANQARWLQHLKKIDASQKQVRKAAENLASTRSDIQSILSGRKKTTTSAAAATMDSLLPYDVQMELAQATTTSKQKKALQDELDALDRLLKQGRSKLTKDELLQLEQERTSVLSQLHQTASQEASARQSATAKAVAAAEAAAQRIQAVQQQAVQAAQSALDAAKSAFESGWSQVASAAMDAYDRVTQTRLAQMQDATQAHLARMQADAKTTLDQMQITVAGFGFRYGGQITQTPAEQALAVLQDQQAQVEATRQMADAQQQLATAQANLAKLKTSQGAVFDESTGVTSYLPADASQMADAEKAVVDAQNQIADLQEQAREAALQKQADAEKQAATDQLQAAQDAYQAQEQTAEQNYQRQQDAAAQSYQDQRALQRQALDEQTTAIEQAMEAGTVTTSVGLDRIKKLWAANGVEIGSVAYVLGGQIYTGLAAGLNPVWDLLKQLSDALAGVAGAAGVSYTTTAGNVYQTLTGGGSALMSGSVEDALLLARMQHRPVAMSAGGSFWTQGPTPLMVGEGGESEYVSVTPRSKLRPAATAAARGADVVVNLEVSALDPAQVDWDMVATRVRRSLLRTSKRNAGGIGLS